MKLAKQAGCRYVVFTTKHHEGFSLHDSKIGDFNAGAKLKRDLVKEIVEAARAEGLKVGFYHSLIDWHHDQYEYAKAKGMPHPLAGKPYPNGKRDHEHTSTYLHAQVKELLTNYGKVDILWWDFSSQGLPGRRGLGRDRAGEHGAHPAAGDHHEQPPVFRRHHPGRGRRVEATSTPAKAISPRPNNASPPPACPAWIGKPA